MAAAIRLLITNIPVILLAAALIIAFSTRKRGNSSEHYLAWLLLLPVGADTIWAGFFHVYFPETAATFIGWQVSPF